MEEFFDPVFELVGLFLPHVLDPRPVMAERGVAHGGINVRVVDAVELEREEQQVQGRRGDALLHVAIELGADRVGGVAGIDQRGIGDQPAKAVVDRFILPERLGECAARPLAGGHRGQSPLVGLLE